MVMTVYSGGLTTASGGVLELEKTMRKIIFAFAILAPVAATAAAKKPTGCAGLDETACSMNTACAWSPATVKGEKSLQTGEPYKITRKAYCHWKASRSRTK